MHAFEQIEHCISALHRMDGEDAASFGRADLKDAGERFDLQGFRFLDGCGASAPSVCLCLVVGRDASFEASLPEVEAYLAYETRLARQVGECLDILLRHAPVGYPPGMHACSDAHVPARGERLARRFVCCRGDGRGEGSGSEHLCLMRNACRVLTEVQVTMHVEEARGNIGHFRSFRHYRNAC